MHKLEITGATPEELYFNSVKMLALLLRPPQTVPAEPGKDASSAGAEPATQGEGPIPSGADQAVEAFAGLVSESKKKRGRGSKNAEPAVLNDDISDVGKTIEHEPSKLTLDGDIRPRLRAIQKAHTDRGNDMPACVAYIQKLYGPFNITKADQLKPEQFAEFIEASEAYLNGEA